MTPYNIKTTLLTVSRETAIPELLNSIGAKTGVEIGVFKGQWSQHLLQNWPGTLYMIDPWRPLGDEYEDSSNHQNHLDAYERTMQSIHGFEDRAFMLRGLSEQLHSVFANESLDFVYIDGNHAYDYVKNDIELWWPKLKKGGLLAGHDYLAMDWSMGPCADNGIDKHIWSNDGSDPTINPYKYAGVFGVNPAVDEFCQRMGYDLTLTDEWTASWHFIK